jgi:3-hydroxyisobutyrate dehydrogenase-like beta-hydroxyacid dehydrogenase
LNRNPAIGFIGFGEAGSLIAGGLRSEGLDRLFTFDIRDVRDRAASNGVRVVESPAALAEATDILISAVTASSALEAARQITPFLDSHHIYADINSVSPALKQEIDGIIRSRNAVYVEVAVMAPVPPYRHRAPMLLGGNGAALFAEMMAPFGMRLEVVQGQVGTAAAVKMCRSIVVKGLEALMVECVLGASYFNADDRVFASLNESFPGIDWKKLADYMISRVVIHGERRAHEMEEVAETLRAIGIDPIMAEATARRQAWSVEMNLKSRFSTEGPASYREVLNAINK